MKILATFSGGKDSLATLLWLRNNDYKTFETIFCDTGWESELTYRHIDEITKQLNLNLHILKSKKYNGLIDLSRRKTRFPSTTRRFCTSELKNIPMIDYILDGWLSSKGANIEYNLAKELGLEVMYQGDEV